MSAASISYAINGGAASNVTDGATTYCPPGATVVAALQSSTGIKRWRFVADNPIGGSDPQGSQSAFVYQADTGGTFSCTIVMPQNATNIRFVSETLDSNNNVVKVAVPLSAFQGAAGGSQYARAAVVNTTNVNTASMNVVIDGQTLVAGEAVLLVAQTTGAENGIYYCGTVAANLCALTRAPQVASGAVCTSPLIVEVEKGTSYGGTTWKTTNTGSLTIGTTALTFYPRVIRGSTALASNAANVTTLWIATGATAYSIQTNTNTVVSPRTLTAGAGTGSCTFAGTGGTDAFNYLIVNWG